jgi:hypothetical protein
MKSQAEAIVPTIVNARRVGAKLPKEPTRVTLGILPWFAVPFAGKGINEMLPYFVGGFNKPSVSDAISEVGEFQKALPVFKSGE